MRVRFTPAARTQFLSAVAYVRRENPQAAAVLRQRADHTLRRLEQFPESGRIIPEFPDLPYREVVVRPYRFFYKGTGGQRRMPRRVELQRHTTGVRAGMSAVLGPGSAGLEGRRVGETGTQAAESLVHRPIAPLHLDQVCGTGTVRYHEVHLASADIAKGARGGPIFGVV